MSGCHVDTSQATADVTIKEAITAFCALFTTRYERIDSFKALLSPCGNSSGTYIISGRINSLDHFSWWSHRTAQCWSAWMSRKNPHWPSCCSDVAFEISYPKDIQTIRQDIAIVSFPDMICQHAFTLSIRWSLGELIWTWNTTAKYIEPVFWYFLFWDVWCRDCIDSYDLEA